MATLETLLLYAVMGLATAGALALREQEATAAALGRFPLHVTLWPLFLPSLLSTPVQVPAAPTEAQHAPGVEAAEVRMMQALGGLEDHLPGAVLPPQRQRVRELTEGLRALERRIEEIDRLLASPELDKNRAQAALEDLRGRGHGASDARVISVQARLRNIEELQAMRARSQDALERATLTMEELCSQILLLRLSDDPHGALEGLLGDLASSVESLTAGVQAAM